VTTEVKSKPGFEKIQKACAKALELGLDYLWVDTCCINQQDKTELSRNINSMYDFYQNSAVCLVYLFDAKNGRPIHQSKWFTRGWTLQELVAPRKELFFDKHWDFIGTRITLKGQIASTTDIDTEVLDGTLRIQDVRVSDRIGWVRNRRTTIEHDWAYCLLGILDVKVDIDYDEPVTRTFERLQEKFAQAHPEADALECGFYRWASNRCTMAWRYNSQERHRLRGEKYFTRF